MRVVFVRKDNWRFQSGLIILSEEECEKVKEGLSKDDCEYLMFETSEIKHENTYDVLKKFGIERKMPRGCWIDSSDIEEIDLNHARKIKKELDEIRGVL